MPAQRSGRPILPMAPVCPICGPDDRRDAVCADRVSRAMAHWKLEFGLDASIPTLTREQAQLDGTISALDACRDNLFSIEMSLGVRS